MLRGPLYRDDYRPQFSGHETFPLRYGWLKKAFDAVLGTEDGGDNRSVFIDSDAIARFGVGKNMVASMRHWSTVTGIIADAPGQNGVATTKLGKLIFGAEGLDPYMEHPATAWLLHWNLCGQDTKTTWFWRFTTTPPLPSSAICWSEALRSSPRIGNGPGHQWPRYGEMFPASFAPTWRSRRRARAATRMGWNPHSLSSGSLNQPVGAMGSGSSVGRSHLWDPACLVTR